MTNHESPLTIDVWSDVMCPFCYLGTTVLAAVVDQLPYRDRVDVRYRSYQLMPQLPVGRSVDMIDLLVRERGMPRAQVEALNNQVAARMTQAGLDFHPDRVRATNTRAAHRLSQFAKSHGRQAELMRGLFRAYFADGLDVGSHAVLAELAAEAGLDRVAALDALDSGAFEADVKADERQGREVGVRGVPFFVLDGRYAVSGAQSVEAVRTAIDTAWKARAH